jgi:hypothetical protein
LNGRTRYLARENAPRGYWRTTSIRSGRARETYLGCRRCMGTSADRVRCCQRVEGARSCWRGGACSRHPMGANARTPSSACLAQSSPPVRSVCARRGQTRNKHARKAAWRWKRGSRHPPRARSWRRKVCSLACGVHSAVVYSIWPTCHPCQYGHSAARPCPPDGQARALRLRTETAGGAHRRGRRPTTRCAPADGLLTLAQNF